MQLQDNLVVVLGGSSGIGLAAARAAKAEGARVVIGGRSPERLQAAAQALGGVQTATVDVADEDSVRRLFEGLGKVDHVLSTAGSAVSAKRLQVDSKVFRTAIDTRLFGDLYVAKHAAGVLRADGSITFTAGVASVRPYEGSAVTSAATGAVEALARALAVDLAPIRVNALRPGYVDTPMLTRIFGEQRDAYMATVAKKLLVRRIGRPEEVAEAALFLMKNGYVTGTVLTIDGGHVLA